MGIVKIFHCTVLSVAGTQTAHGNNAFAMQSAYSFISSFTFWAIKKSILLTMPSSDLVLKVFV